MINFTLTDMISVCGFHGISSNLSPLWCLKSPFLAPFVVTHASVMCPIQKKSYTPAQASQVMLFIRVFFRTNWDILCLLLYQQPRGEWRITTPGFPQAFLRNCFSEWIWYLECSAKSCGPHARPCHSFFPRKLPHTRDLVHCALPCISNMWDLGKGIFIEYPLDWVSAQSSAE